MLIKEKIANGLKKTLSVIKYKHFLRIIVIENKKKLFNIYQTRRQF